MKNGNNTVNSQRLFCFAFVLLLAFLSVGCNGDREEPGASSTAESEAMEQTQQTESAASPAEEAHETEMASAPDASLETLDALLSSASYDNHYPSPKMERTNRYLREQPFEDHAILFRVEQFPIFGTYHITNEEDDIPLFNNRSLECYNDYGDYIGDYYSYSFYVSSTIPESLIIDIPLTRRLSLESFRETAENGVQYGGLSLNYQGERMAIPGIGVDGESDCYAYIYRA